MLTFLHRIPWTAKAVLAALAALAAGAPVFFIIDPVTAMVAYGVAASVGIVIYYLRSL